MAYSYGYWAQSARAEAEAQYQLKLSEAREAVNELVRHIHVSLIVATKSSNTSYIAQLCFHRLSNMNETASTSVR